MSLSTERQPHTNSMLHKVHNVDASLLFYVRPYGGADAAEENQESVRRVMGFVWRGVQHN